MVHTLKLEVNFVCFALYILAVHHGWEEEEVRKRSGLHVDAGQRELLFMKLVSITAPCNRILRP